MSDRRDYYIPVWGSAIVASMLMVAVACSRGTAPESEKAELETQADKVQQTRTIARVYHRPTEPELAPQADLAYVSINKGAGVINPKFTEYTDLFPDYWYVEHTPVRIQESAGPDGSPAVRMGPGYTYSLISQDLVFDESPAGKKITLTAMARTNEPGKAKIMIRLSDSTYFVSDTHPGDDTWRDLTVSTTIPDSFPGDTITISLNHGGNPKAPCYYDNVRFYVD